MQEVNWLGVIAVIAFCILIGYLVFNSIRKSQNAEGHFDRYSSEKKSDHQKNLRNIQDNSTTSNAVVSPIHNYQNIELACVNKGYMLQSELGRGGMATVYLAHNNKFDTNVAIKVLNKEFVHNDNIRKRFLSEAKSMFKMSHPNIIKVNDLIEENDAIAFVMEYIEGETLKEYLDRNGKLKDDVIKAIFTQMLEAAGYVHKQNLIHRDIKPSNFMINKDGEVKLIDFGIAKNTDTSSAEYTQTNTGMQMGTLTYMSPEQIKSSKDVGPQTDIYSLGVVLWQMVTGKKPYDTSAISSFDMQLKIVHEDLPYTNSIWDACIKGATYKNTQLRFKSIAAFESGLPGSSSEHTIIG
jgi:serine/threonine-protein kinase